MSKKVITDLVLPIILKQLRAMGENISTYDDIKDETILEYFEQELNKALGVTGSVYRSDCPELEERIKEQLRENPEIFERGIRLILEKYINLKMKLATSKKLKPKQLIQEIVGHGSRSTSGPPDRFQDQRKMSPFGPKRWIGNKVCPQCGAPVEPTSTSCPLCGKVF